MKYPDTLIHHESDHRQGAPCYRPTVFSLHEPALFTRLRDARRVLIAGGGFDVYAGLPLALALRASGKEVHLANLSFADLYDPEAGDAVHVAEAVHDGALGGRAAEVGVGLDVGAQVGGEVRS
jgi:hypothetical protein